MRRRPCVLLASVMVAASGCGLQSGSPMVDAVKPGSIGQGDPWRAPI